MRSTQQIRLLYQPACQVKDRGRGFLEAWQALATVMAAFHYTPRPADTGARNCRRITGGSGYSLHSYFAEGAVRFANGLAVALAVAMDINWKSNPYGPRLVTDMPRPMVDAICAIRTVGGVQVFRWGGYYSGNKDSMHWEIVASPAELARGIDPRTVHHGHADPAPVPGVPEEDHDMPTAFQYGDDLDTFAVDTGGALVQRYYQPATGGWHTIALADGCREDATPAVVKDYRGETGRLDVFAEGAHGGLVHAWFVPGHEWEHEALA